MQDETPPTLDYKTPAKRRSLWDSAVSFGAWLSTPRPLVVYYVATFVLGIVALILAVLIRAIVVGLGH
jgi:hypothetical protein